MSTALEQYRPIFAQQRLFNYASILLSVLAILAVFGLISVSASAPVLYTVPFLMFYGLMILSARVRSNPLIRCTIENADIELYNNLWRWSVIAGVIVLLSFVVGQLLIWHMVGSTLNLSVTQFVGLSAVNAILIGSVALE